MAVSYQYKSGGNWVDVPDYAHPDDTGGTVVVEHPQAAALDGQGYPCGAVGLPRIRIASNLLTGTGWNWYQAFFSDAIALKATITGITAFDPRSGTWKKYTGSMWRPTGTVVPGSTAARTLYSNVEIIIADVTVTT
jgi:hypothetical protein